MKNSIENHMVHVYSSMSIYNQKCYSVYRYENFITPKHFIDYINIYLQIIEKTDIHLNRQIAKLSDATEKTTNATIHLNLLKQEVEETKMKVSNSTRHCENVLEQIEECKKLVLFF